MYANSINQPSKVASIYSGGSNDNLTQTNGRQSFSTHPSSVNSFVGLPNMQSVLDGRLTTPFEKITDEAILALKDSQIEVCHKT